MAGCRPLSTPTTGSECLMPEKPTPRLRKLKQRFIKRLKVGFGNIPSPHLNPAALLGLPLVTHAVACSTGICCGVGLLIHPSVGSPACAGERERTSVLMMMRR